MIKIFSNLLDISTIYKILLIFFIDLLIIFITLYLSVCLRLDLIYPIEGKFLFIYLINIIIFCILSVALKFYNVLFRYLTLVELIKYLKFSVIFSFFSFLFVLIYSPSEFPRSAPLINTFIFPLVLISSRFFIASLIRLFQNSNNSLIPEEMNSVAIYGAGFMGSILLDTLKKEKKFKNIIFIDDDPNKINRYLNGIKIFKAEDILNLISDYKIDTIIISAANLSHIKKNKIASVIESSKIKIFNFSNLIDKPTTEFNELLDFKKDFFIESKIKNNLTISNQNFFENEVILITGGGGSIGSELSRQISSYNFDKLIIADISEFNLFNIREEIYELYKFSENKINKIKFVLLDLKDEKQINELFVTHSPNIIYHAAAYKHVPIVESNIKIGIKNNFLGTANLIKLSFKYKVKNFLFVSTDKAVKPLNLMGMTKRLGELYLKKITNDNNLNYSIVRFGNVVGSSGSVIPLFIDQIRNGGPVTVTHKDATRYFMTIPDAVSLIINTSIIAKGGEIFVLNMGDPKKIYEVAQNLISKTYAITNGAYSKDDINIKIIGLREGEKLHEEIYIETVKSSSNDKILLSLDKKNENYDIIKLYENLNSKIDIISSEEIYKIIREFFAKK